MTTYHNLLRHSLDLMTVCWGIWHQAASRRSFMSCKLQAGASVNRTCFISRSHRRSIGLKSGEFGSQVNTANPLCSLNHSGLHQTRPPPLVSPWSSSDAHMSIVGTLGCGHGSAWPPWLVCGYTAPYTTNCNALCVLIPLISEPSINFFSNLSYSSSTGSDYTGSQHASMKPLMVFLPWTTFGSSWPLQTGNIPQDLQFLEMLWPSLLAITIWPMSKSFKSLCLFCFQQINFRNSVFTCLIYPIDFQIVMR